MAAIPHNDASGRLFVKAKIAAVSYYLPETVVTNEDLAREFPEWPCEKIQAKTGICQRHIAKDDECSSDLALNAARRLFEETNRSPKEIDYILLCTQSPDYFLPTTACLIQHRLGVPTCSGALDFNLGCSGFVYGLGVAHGLIQTQQASRVLLLTAETYSKFIHPQDKSVRTLFGDASSATLIEAVEDGNAALQSVVYAHGSDGSGAENLIVTAGAMRRRRSEATAETTQDENGNVRSLDHLFMNGAEIFNFTLKVVPDCVDRVLAKARRTIEDIDLFVFHQANQYMLEHLRKKLKIAPEKFLVHLRECGNTVSSTIPIALREAIDRGRLQPGQTVMLVGFGVGYSWSAAVFEWPFLVLPQKGGCYHTPVT
jgi:3-oxoacyl-[acyl-carrier-protein] synthase III